MKSSSTGCLIVFILAMFHLSWAFRLSSPQNSRIKSSGFQPFGSKSGSLYGTLERDQGPKYEPKVPTKEDVECIESRQVFHKVTPFGVSQKPCQYGFPQAFAYHPSKHRFNTNLFRLTCPKLVEAIDEYEKGSQQAIVKMNMRLESDPSFKAVLAQINADHAAIRKEVMGPSEIERMKGVMGEEVAKVMMESGITGMSPNVLHDVKCLHAHVADYLCRGPEANPIGAEVYADLRGRLGVPVEGCDACRAQCDRALAPDVRDAPWVYLPRKNHQKLRQKAQRRKIIKENTERKERERNLAAQEEYQQKGQHCSEKRSNQNYREVLDSPTLQHQEEQQRQQQQHSVQKLS